jgi:hypothetical protein
MKQPLNIYTLNTASIINLEAESTITLRIPDSFKFWRFSELYDNLILNVEDSDDGKYYVEVKRRSVSTIPTYIKYCDGFYGPPRWALKMERSAQPFLWMNLLRDHSLVFLDGETYLNRGAIKAIKLRTVTPDYINGIPAENFKEAFHGGFLDDGTEFLNETIHERVYREIVPTLRSL